MNITINNIDINLLRQQRDFIIELLSVGIDDPRYNDNLEGLLNMLDGMLDAAEGFINV